MRPSAARVLARQSSVNGSNCLKSMMTCPDLLIVRICCNSHYLSHFAAFFIDARAKRSVVKSFISYNKTTFVTIMFSIKVDASIQQFTGVMDRITNSVTCWHIRTEATDDLNSIMILPQVHLRKPCYDFYFL